MKRILLAGFLFSVGIIAEVKAQQEPQFTHYMHNTLMYNPAYAGSREGICATFINHDQWTNFQGPEKDKAPRTQNFTIDGAIPTADANTSIGLGLNFINDHEGFITTNQFDLAGSYIKSMSFGGTLAGGIDLGYISKAIDPTWVAVNPGDPHLPGKVSSGAVDLGLGVFYNSAKYWAGISALHLTAPRVSWASSTNYKIARTYFLTAGYNYQIGGNPDYVLQPSVLVKKDVAVTSFAVTGTFLWKQLIWGGLSYRSEQITALSGMIGIYLFKGKGKIGYSYDIATSQATAFGGTSEFMVGYCFKLNLKPPVNIYDKGVRYL